MYNSLVCLYLPFPHHFENVLYYLVQYSIAPIMHRWLEFELTLLGQSLLRISKGWDTSNNYSNGKDAGFLHAWKAVLLNSLASTFRQFIVIY